MDALSNALLASVPPPVEDLGAWWTATAAARAAGATTIDRALLGGACADRLGFAFAGGYAEALRALVPALGGAVAALCATEEGGAHPRAIRTRLVPAAGVETAGVDGSAHAYRLTGRKRWATAATIAAELLVIASTGTDDAGRNRLRAVRVRADAPGVRLTATIAPFVPEIPHAEVSLDDVPVAADDILPGDGYADYLKPFRTVEDLHVHAALLGYLVGVARRHAFDPSLLERALALCAIPRALAGASPSSPATHLALAGLLTLTSALLADLEPAWATLGGPEHTRWQRDRSLLAVAAGARTARRAAARAALLAHVADRAPATR